MRKLLLIQPRLPHYRIPIFNGLAEKYDVTVLHSGKIVNGKGLKFKQHFSEIKRILSIKT